MSDLLFFTLMTMVASGAALLARVRGPRGGRAPVAAGLALGAGAWALYADSEPAAWACIAITLVGVVLPVRVFAWARRRAARGELARAARIARALARVQPARTLTDWAELWEAADAWYAGDARPAEALAARLAASDAPHARAFLDGLVALTRDWERGVHAQAIDLQSRSLCELGAVDAGVEVVARAWVGRMGWRTLVRARGLLLAPLAFAGRVVAVEQLTRLLRLPAPHREVWRATALAAAGQRADARYALDRLLLNAQDLPPALTSAIRARRDALPRPPELGAAARDVLRAATREVSAGAVIRMRAFWTSTPTLLVLFLVFVGWSLQAFLGGPGNGYAVIERGALLVDGDLPAEPWRLLSYGFLHFGVAHLLANTAAIAVLGPIVSAALGGLGGGFVFFGSVAGAGAAISLFGSPGVTLGASGGAMGLIGALLAVALRHPGVRGTLTGSAAARPLVVLVVAQALLDAVVPQLSFVGHAAGAATGFALTALVIAARGRVAAG